MSLVLSVVVLSMLLAGLSFGGSQAEASSPYEVNVSLPACDSNNSQVQFISTDADWDLINNSSKSIFCVEPGDYTSVGNIILSTSGTSSAKRYIRYYNPSNPNDNTHPVDMSSSDLATIRKLTFQGADFVVVDRLHVKEPDTVRTGLVRFHGSYTSTDNVLNRLLVEGGGDGGGQVSFNGASGSDRNTLQLSVVRNTIISSGEDNHCVVITDDAEDSKVISNELYNCAGDVLQIHPGVYDGTIIANNDIYDESGFVQNTENGIDIKGGGSSGSANLVTIEGNRFFSLGGTGGTGGSIGAVDFSNDVGVKSYILFKNNIFFDNPLPWTTNTGSGTGSAHHLSIVGNLIYNAGAAAIEPIKNTNSIEIYYNTIINVASAGNWLHGSSISPSSEDVMCNVVINGQGVLIPSSGTTADYNAYYNTPGELLLPGTNDVTGSTAAASNNTSYTFQYKLLTDPQNYTIP
ncbi:MAG: Right handed beta helix region, partial [Paenibacillaceae bacterium]|nr:Right handed beta helix region [Paenibacillaceae bacterium]